MSSSLSKLVQDKVAELGKDAGAYFNIPPGLLAQWISGAKPPSLAAAQKVLDSLPPTHEFFGGGVEMAPPQALQILDAPEPVMGSDQVYLGMPLYTDVEKLTFITLVRSMKLYGMEKVSIIPIARTLIDEARNTIVQRFMKTGAEWLVFVDSDMILPCGSGAILKKMGLDLPEPKASRNALARIMSHPKDKRIVGAVYQNRRPSFKPALATAYLNAQEETRMRDLFTGKNKADGLEETGWVGFGMVRIHRSVFVDMQAAAVPGGVLAEMAPPVGREADAYGYFGRSAQIRGEDIALCRRAQKVGVKVYADFGLLLGHQGERYNLT